MKNILSPAIISISIAATLVGAGCATTSSAHLSKQFGESCVFVGEQPAQLAFVPSRSGPIRVRNTYLPEINTVEFVEGRDFVVDRADGTIRRTPESRIPNFQKNILYGQDNFDHNKFPGFGNKGYFVFIDYTFAKPVRWPRQKSQVKYLSATRAKLRDGASVKIVAYGDSITAGGDASRPDLIFWQRWADALQKKYPDATITAVNGATGGDSTVPGLARLQEKVLDAQPDVVLIGFGMNDHNRGGVPVPQFEVNLKEMISKIRATTKAEIVLFSAFPPNPKWTYGTHNMEAYAAATARVAVEAQCAFADVFNNWQAIATRKKPEDLLGNNINHPNDYGHWIYFETLNAMGL